jgi:hypothetical protein
MAVIIVMGLEGVLTETDDLRTSPPHKTGYLLYEGLRKGGFQMVLLAASAEMELVRSWLRKEHITDFATVRCRPASSILSVPAWKLTQLRELAADGWKIACFMDSDPAAVAAAFHEGVATNLISYPRYSRPEWRPDATRSVRAWDDLVSTLEKENLSREKEEVG